MIYLFQSSEIINAVYVERLECENFVHSGL
jgi:hypothetical protein